MRRPRPTLRAFAGLLAATMLSASPFAQTRPSGGGLPMRPPSSEDARPRAADESLPPDPWRAWRQSLEQARGSLALAAAQQAAFDAVLRDLDDVQRLYTARVLRLMRGAHPVFTARPDPERDLRNEQADAADWADALADLGRSWQAFAAQLTPAQRELALQAYARSRLLARQPGGPAAPPGRGPAGDGPAGGPGGPPPGDGSRAPPGG